MINQYIARGEINIGVTLVDSFAGGVSMLMAASPMTLPACVAGSTALGTATYVGEQYFYKEEITPVGVFASAAGGTVSGFIGGKGANVNSLTSSYRSLGIVIERENRRLNTQVASKRIMAAIQERNSIKNSAII